MNKYSTQYERLGITKDISAEAPIEKAEIIFQAACTKLGIDASTLPSYSGLPTKYAISQQGHLQLMIIRDALVENKEAVWNNWEERKYGAWFYLNNPGFRFDDSVYSLTAADAGAGSRLCTFSREDEEFFCTECIALWADFMGGKLP